MSDPTFLLSLSSHAVQDFVFAREHDDELELTLKKEILGLPASLIANQISGRRKARLKLPTWYRTKGIVYPPSLNLEQSSSEATAKFKSEIVREIFGSKRIVAADLTGGFGVDSFYLSAVCENVSLVESNEELLKYTQHNHRVLGAKNIHYESTTAEIFLASLQNSVDLFFIDPSRRSDARKVFRLADCSPNIVQLQGVLLKKSIAVLVKCSPMLDIQQAINDLQNVKLIWVVSVGNECKELLFLLDPTFRGEPTIKAITLYESGLVHDSYEFTFTRERGASVPFSEPLAFLYEPNASILKGGAFKSVGHDFGLSKFHVNTHLYTSSELKENFPGRIFSVICAHAGEPEIKSLLPNRQANVITRNYPLTADALKKKLKLKDGGDFYLIGYSSPKKKIISLATRVK